MNNNLFIYRRKAGLRQLDLARKLGMSEQGVSNIETGRTRVTIDRATQIASILRVEPEEVFPDTFK